MPILLLQNFLEFSFVLSSATAKKMFYRNDLTYQIYILHSSVSINLFNYAKLLKIQLKIRFHEGQYKIICKKHYSSPYIHTKAEFNIRITKSF